MFLSQTAARGCPSNDQHLAGVRYSVENLTESRAHGGFVEGNQLVRIENVTGS
jgi:hypothetical protein